MQKTITANIPGGTAGNETRLPGFIDMVRESVDVYRKFWKPLVKLQLFGNVVALGGGILFAVVARVFAMTAAPSLNNITTVAGVLLGLTCLAAFLVLVFWVGAAAIVVLRDANENISIYQALTSAKAYAFPCIIASIFTLLAIFFGLAFFIIPGLIFAVWLMFASFIIVAENLNWHSALRRSRDYTRGYFWSVFLLAALGVVSILFVNSFFDILESVPQGGLFRFAANLFIAPIYSIYYFLIYSRLRKDPTANITSVQTAGKTAGGKYVLFFALAGLLAVFAVIGFAVYYAPQIEEYGRNAIEEYNRQNPGHRLPEPPETIKLQ